jgi:ankyrin repeat protein
VKTFLCVAVALAGATLHAADGSPRLIDAVKQGNVAAVRGLIARHANVNAAEPDGMTALHWAVRGGEAEMAQLLVRGGADVNAANRYGVTPLSLAAQTGEPRLVDLLLEAGADANRSSSEGQTPIMTAARTGNPEVIRSLAAYGADLNAREEWQGQTAIMWAAARNHAAAIATLVELGADKNARSKILQFPEFKFETSGNPVTALPRGGWTPLMHAARDGAIDAARALADAGADLNATDPDGTTALLLAITNAHFDTAAALLDKGADPNVPDSTGMAALYAAVDMDTLPPAFGRPAPKLVDSIDAAGLVKVLLTHGADPNARLKRPIFGRHHLPTGDPALGEGTTPLARASKSNDLAVMNMLLDGGADPTLTLRDRTTPLMVVAAGGAVAGAYAGAIPPTDESALAAMKLLVAHGLDVDAFNTAGQTALHLAAARGADRVIRYLAEADATLDIHNKQGRTPLDVAISGFRAPPPVNMDEAPARPTESTIALLRGLTADAGLIIPAGSR